MGGRHGIVYERVDEPTMLQRFSKSPWSLLGLTRSLAELHILIHQQKVSELPSQREKLAESIRNASSAPQEIKETALRALEGLSDDNVLCHGDFHPDQIIMSERGLIIIDWRTATKGNPVGDVAQSSILLRLGAPPAGRANEWLIRLARAYVHSRYLKRYVDGSSISQRAIDEWQLPIAVARLGAGIPEEKGQLLALIERLTVRGDM